jgi:hypothetical protein
MPKKLDEKTPDPVSASVPGNRPTGLASKTTAALSWRKKLIFAAITVLFPLFLLVAVVEIGGRIYIHFRFGIPGKSYGIYMADDELGATHRPNSYNTNSVINNFGLRSSEDNAEEKPKGITRVYCSGGSTTFCYNLDTDQSWPSRLQKKLRGIKGHELDEVLNAGQITFGVAQEFALAKRLIPRLKPDIVIIFTAINELLAANIIAYQDGKNLDELLSQQRWGVCPTHPDQSRFLKRESVLVRLLDYKIKKLFESRATSAYRTTEMPEGAVHPWVAANFEHTLRDYLRYLRAQGCKVIVFRFGDNGKEDWYLRQCIRVLRDRAVDIGREEKAAVSDIVPDVDQHPRRHDLFLNTGVHVTRQGAELYADFLLKEVLAQMPDARTD